MCSLALRPGPAPTTSSNMRPRQSSVAVGARRLSILVGVLLGVGGLHCHSPRPISLRNELHGPRRVVSTGPLSPHLRELERLAARGPLGFLRLCRQHYLDTVSDYRCRFHVKERVGGVDTGEQEMDVLFRENPYSVDMRWVRNPGPARRLTYVAGRWHRDGREQALIYPRGLLALLAPAGVKRHIHASDVQRAARRTIDQFGFKNTLEFIIKYCEMAQGDSAYDLRYVGRGEVDSRLTFVFERHLPFTIENAPYPDRLQVIHIDCEWLVPTACHAYADDARKQLLGRYITTDAEFNIGLTDEDF